MYVPREHPVYLWGQERALDPQELELKMAVSLDHNPGNICWEYNPGSQEEQSVPCP